MIVILPWVTRIADNTSSVFPTVDFVEGSPEAKKAVNNYIFCQSDCSLPDEKHE